MSTHIHFNVIIFLNISPSQSIRNISVTWHGWEITLVSLCKFNGTNLFFWCLCPKKEKNRHLCRDPRKYLTIIMNITFLSHWCFEPWLLQGESNKNRIINSHNPFLQLNEEEKKPHMKSKKEVFLDIHSFLIKSIFSHSPGMKIKKKKIQWESWNQGMDTL